MADYWACLEIQIATFDDGICTRIITDAPVHLWMYRTTIAPLKQPQSVKLRGVYVMWESRFCFVKYRTIEQKEDGDTLVHTFPLTVTLDPASMWFTFRGKIAGAWSYSCAPLFFTPFPNQNVITNWNFEERSPLGDWPNGWDKFIGGTGWSRWTYAALPVPYLRYGPRLEAGGYARLTGLRKSLPVDALRNQQIYLTLQFYGLAYSNNGIHLYTDGSPALNLWAVPTYSSTWSTLSVEGLVPENATYCKLEMRCYSPGYGPVYAYLAEWDNITLRR